MSCDQSRKLFGPYWDDEITQAEREWLESHFAGCAGCRAEYDDWVHALELLAALPRVEVTPGLAERSLARARRAAPMPDRVSPRVPHWVPVTATAVLVALCAAALLQWSGLAPTARLARRADVPPADGVASPGDREFLGPGGAEPVAGVPEPRLADPAMAVAADSLFDHSEDVEFILDPVTLRQGRAHTVSRLAPSGVRGEQAVITF